MPPHHESPASARHDVPADIVRAQLRGDFLLNLGVGFAFALYQAAGEIAKLVLQAEDWHVAAIHMALHFGLVLTIVTGSIQSGRRKVPFVVVPAVLMMATFTAVGFTTNATAFSLMIVLAFSLHALSAPAKTSLYAANYPAGSRGRLVSRVRQVLLLSTVAGALFSSWVSRDNPTAYQYLFPAAGILGLLLTLPYARVPEPAGTVVHEDRKSVRRSVAASIRVLRTDVPFARFMGLWFVFGLANIMSMTLMVLLFADLAKPLGDGVAVSHALLLKSVVPPVVMFFMLVYWGRVLDQKGSVWMRGPVNMLWAFSPLLWGLTPLAVRYGWLGDGWFGWGTTLTAVAILYGAQVFCGMAQAGGQLIWMLGIVPYAKTREEVPIYMATHTTLNGIRGLCAAPLALGLAYCIGVEWALLACAAVMFSTGVITLLFERAPEHGGVDAAAPPTRPLGIIPDVLAPARG